MLARKELIVKFSTPTSDWPIMRQTPGCSGKWGNCQFVHNADIDECDFWFVYDGLSRPEKTLCAKNRVILITGEPPTVKNYKQSFIDQFSTIITCNRNVNHSNVIFSQQALPWMVGGRYKQDSNSWEDEFSKDYDELTTISTYNKTNLLSVIVSNKIITSGHKKRIEFVRLIKEYYGNKLDIFGAGNNKLEDKWDGIAPYKYSIVIENSTFRNYWTEKLSDAYLGGSYPLYYGCPNIYDYFSNESLAVIDINNASHAIETINKVIEANTYEKSVDKIEISKKLILNKYNVFAIMTDYCNNQQMSDDKMPLTLFPENFRYNNIPQAIKCISKRIKKCLN